MQSRETDIEDSFCSWDERNTEGLTANVDALGGKNTNPFLYFSEIFKEEKMEIPFTCL